jgi:hypothetical protein
MGMGLSEARLVPPRGAVLIAGITRLSPRGGAWRHPRPAGLQGTDGNSTPTLRPPFASKHHELGAGAGVALVRCMRHRRRIHLCLLLATLAPACTLGDVSTDDDDDDDDIVNDPDIECTAQLTVTGTMSPAGETPGAEAGCIPMGTWTVNVAVSDDGGCADVAIESQYVYVVTEASNATWDVAYPADPAADTYLQMRSNGPGDCAGTFQHTSADGNQDIILKAFERDLVITGSGTFDQY